MKVFLTYLKKERRLHMEIEILSMLQKIRTPLLDIFMSNITKLGNAGIVWILLTIVLLLIPKTRKSGLILASALIVDLILCNGILKPLIARIRPVSYTHLKQTGV